MFGCLFGAAVIWKCHFRFGRMGNKSKILIRNANEKNISSNCHEIYYWKVLMWKSNTLYIWFNLTVNIDDNDDNDVDNDDNVTISKICTIEWYLYHAPSLGFVRYIYFFPPQPIAPLPFVLSIDVIVTAVQPFTYIFYMVYVMSSILILISTILAIYQWTQWVFL